MATYYEVINVDGDYHEAKTLAEALHYADIHGGEIVERAPTECHIGYKIKGKWVWPTKHTKE